MDQTFLDIYEDELRFLREMGQEFAASHPKIGARLALGRDEVPDPYVERLLEGFAFLTARVRLKMKAQYPQFTQNLLALLYPNLVAPTPSCTVLELEPDFRDDVISQGFTVPRGSSFLAKANKSGQTCEFTSTSDMVLRALAVDEAELHDQPAFLQKWLPDMPDAKAAIRIRIRLAGEAPLDIMALEPLQFHITGDGSQPSQILRALTMNSVGARAYPVGLDFVPAKAPPVTLCHDGFGVHENLLPHTAKTFSGHRLMQEAFILPEKFHFVSFAGLHAALQGQNARAFDIIIGLSHVNDALTQAVSPKNFRLHCVPVINLFERRADRVPVDQGQAEYKVVVDRTRPHAFEVYDVISVEGLIEKQTERLPFKPLFQPTPTQGTEDIRSVQGYFNLRRSARLFSDARSGTSYLGSDVHLNLSGPSGGPTPLGLGQLIVTTLCTNRGIAAQLGNGIKMTPQSLLPVTRVKAIMRPTPPRGPLSQDDSGWDLINALSLNHLSFAGDAQANAAWLSQLLGLFIDRNDDVHRQTVKAFRGLAASIVNRRLPGEGPVAYGRGLKLSLDVETDYLRGTGAFVLSSVLERFFARAATLNSFTQTTLSTDDGDVDAHWPVRLGVRHLL